MKNDIQQLIQSLKDDNDKRSKELNTDISQYRHTALVHIYNNTLETIKLLEKIIEKY